MSTLEVLAPCHDISVCGTGAWAPQGRQPCLLREVQEGFLDQVASRGQKDKWELMSQRRVPRERLTR